MAATAPPGPRSWQQLRRPARTATVLRKTKETDIRVRVNLDRDRPHRHRDRHRLLRPHARAARAHGGFALELTCTGDLRDRRAPHGRGLRAGARPGACAKRSATSAASRASASCCRWTRPRRRSRSICRAAPTLVFEGKFGRETRRRAADRAGAALLPFAGRQPAGRGPRAGDGREHAPHGRGLLQGHGSRAAPGDQERGRPNCRAARACCEMTRRRDHRQRRRQHRLAALRARAARRIVAADRRCRRAASRAATSSCPASAPRPMPWSGCTHSGWSTVIPTLTQPVLGICLGMQLLFEGSEEGDTECLGIFPARVTPVSAIGRAFRCRTWAGTSSCRRPARR